MAMEKQGNILILTGAGISAESGLATFRAADGLWEGPRVEDFRMSAFDPKRKSASGLPYRFPSMRDRPNLKTRLVVKGELVDDIGTGAIVPDHLDRAPLSPQPCDNLVQGTDG